MFEEGFIKMPTTKRGFFNWCVWIGIWTGIYTAVYLLITPLAAFGVISVTFIALPIYFISGANKKELPNFAVGNVTGVLWGLVYILSTDLLISFGLNGTVATALACGVVTLICCSFHMIVTPNTVFNKLPAMFGGISATFSQWGNIGSVGTEDFPLIGALMLTLVFGRALALLMATGTRFLTESGRWKFLSKS
jgi:hypothetical protein